MKMLVTGGAGFIGSHLIYTLLDMGHQVVVVDDLSLGRKEHIQPFMERPQFTFHEGKIQDSSLMDRILSGVDVVFHLAANSDIAASCANAQRDFDIGTLGTFVVLEACRKNSIRQFVFASTSAIYGEATVRPTPEDYAPLFPISHYGASKLAAEGMISAYGHNYGMKACFFRFANIVGPHATHGVIRDFMQRLKSDPSRLKILGDGTQCKSYLHVTDCVGGILFGWQRAQDTINAFNLAHPGTVTVRDIADICVSTVGLSGVHYEFTGGNRGWVGDVPVMELACERINRLGWTASMTSREAILRAAREIAIEQGLMS